ncbi:hypothetical protein [Pedococcus bigeumensis]|uniref:hypothetical protein n=1 Tax=Pedococcus bigeumensis TaxID=433644 RepID=UPI0019D5404F|nr:hypothetical protein [Pedococcus bigeumensis]
MSGVLVAVALFALAALVAHLPGIDVHAGSAAPLLAAWGPRVGVGTAPALALVWWSTTQHPWRATSTMGWGRLLTSVWALSLTWMLSLALIDGVAGVGGVLTHDSEYLVTARGVDDVGELLRSFVSRIPLSPNDHWPVHVAGHPPGALLFFVGLVRLGLGSGLSAGLVVCIVAATTPVAVAVTCRALGAEARVRSVLPLLAIGPFALWQAVSADAVFAAVAAWSIALVALAATASRRSVAFGLAAAAGLALGGCVMLSYGLPLVGAVAVAVLAAVGGWRADLLRLAAAIAAAVTCVVLGFALAGFAYWDAYPVLHQRYWDGLASARPAAYWVWANLALLAVCAGPLLFGSLAVAGRRLVLSVRRPQDDPALTLVAGAFLAVLVADLSLMSKAEVERIWLPFVPWLLLSAVVLPVRWRRTALFVQAGLALLVQSLLVTPW